MARSPLFDSLSTPSDRGDRRTRAPRSAADRRADRHVAHAAPLLRDATFATAGLVLGGCKAAPQTRRRRPPHGSPAPASPSSRASSSSAAAWVGSTRPTSAEGVLRRRSSRGPIGRGAHVHRDQPVGDGLTTELGGEFIDSTHEEMLALYGRVQARTPRHAFPQAEKLKPETYFINGRHYTQGQAARAFVPLAKQSSRTNSMVKSSTTRPKAAAPRSNRQSSRNTSTRSAPPAGCASCSRWRTSRSTASTRRAGALTSSA